ncbi:YolD-like family protein [Oceanobacillus senegalensis]|uniref:YolD-like family protein n=1 Tax=Oceanobacillus senegalensis TaxID=1936063 RepID=UPI000A30A27D|nr:YolD-like family protein [Oceanobacillus senegalensis]
MQRDRGSIKWTSLMLPEHVELLNQLWEEDTKRSKPILDPQQLEDINHRLVYALENDKTITISIYDHAKEYHYTGKIKKTHPTHTHLLFQLENGSTMDIAFEKIIAIM